MTSRYRVLYVCNNPDYFELHWGWRARAVAAIGHDVAVAVPRADGGSDARIDGIRTFELVLDRKGTDLRDELLSLHGLGAVIRRFSPDIMHGITAKPNLYAGWWGRRRGIPVVMSVTGLGTVFVENSLKYRMLRQLVLRAYRYVAAPRTARLSFENPDDRGVFVEARIGEPDRLLLHNGVGVDVARFLPSPATPSGPPLVVLPARMLWSKGIGEFVAAAGRLRAQGVPVRMALVGDPDPGNPASVDATQLATWAHEGVIEWWGYQADMPAVLAQASVICLPSYREGLPRTLLEAAACGIPCITTDTPGCRRVVVNGVTGLLVPPRNAEALAKAIASLLADGDRRRAMGAAGRQRAVAEFSEEQVLATTLTLYDDMITAKERRDLSSPRVVGDSAGY